MIPRILAVDDDEPILDLIDNYLPAYELKKARSGADALAVFDTFRPQLVLLDVAMPEMDGVQTLMRLRGRPRGAQTTFVMLTARADKTTVDKARAAGAAGYLLKPIAREKFVNRVNAMLGREQVFAID